MLLKSMPLWKSRKFFSLITEKDNSVIRNQQRPPSVFSSSYPSPKYKNLQKMPSVVARNFAAKTPIPIQALTSLCAHIRELFDSLHCSSIQQLSPLLYTNKRMMAAHFAI